MPKTVHVFDGLSSSEVQKILAHGVLQEHAKGETLFEKGSRGDTLYLIVDGQVRIYAELHGIEIDLAKLSKGDVFGEIAAVTHAPRSANAKISKKTTLFVFQNDTLGRLTAEEPTIATRLYFNLLCITARRLAETNRKLVAERVERLDESLL